MDFGSDVPCLEEAHSKSGLWAPTLWDCLPHLKAIVQYKGKWKWRTPKSTKYMCVLGGGGGGGGGLP